jgi:hypothetical protein
VGCAASHIRALGNCSAFALDVDLRVRVADFRSPKERMPELSLARIVFPDAKDVTAGVLVIHACRLGCYLTGGRGEVCIPVKDGSEVRRAVGDLLTTPENEAAELVLDQELWIIDSSLKNDVAKALGEMMAAIDRQVAGS